MGEDLSELENKVNTIDATQVDGKTLLQKLKDLYFEPKFFERSGKIYELLGVKQLKKICEYIGRKIGEDRKYEQNYFIWDRSLKGLKAFERKTRLNEGIHLFSAACLSCATIGSIAYENYEMVALWGTLDLALGIYPIIIQRYNRARLYNTMEKMESRDTCLPK